MKVIIAGSRNIDIISYVEMATILSGYFISEVVSGGAKGVDKLGEQWAYKKNIPIKMFPADWDKHGRAAGPIRNAEMADYADALVAIPALEGESRGTKNMIQAAKKKGLKVFVSPRPSLKKLRTIATFHQSPHDSDVLSEVYEYILTLEEKIKDD